MSKMLIDNRDNYYNYNQQYKIIDVDNPENVQEILTYDNFITNDQNPFMNRNGIDYINSYNNKFEGYKHYINMILSKFRNEYYFINCLTENSNKYLLVENSSLYRTNDGIYASDTLNYFGSYAPSYSFAKLISGEQWKEARYSIDDVDDNGSSGYRNYITAFFDKDSKRVYTLAACRRAPRGFYYFDYSDIDNVSQPIEYTPDLKGCNITYIDTDMFSLQTLDSDCTVGKYGIVSSIDVTTSDNVSHSDYLMVFSKNGNTIETNEILNTQINEILTRSVLSSNFIKMLPNNKFWVSINNTETVYQITDTGINNLGSMFNDLDISTINTMTVDYENNKVIMAYKDSNNVNKVVQKTNAFEGTFVKHTSPNLNEDEYVLLTITSLKNENGQTVNLSDTTFAGDGKLHLSDYVGFKDIYHWIVRKNSTTTICVKINGYKLTNKDLIIGTEDIVTDVVLESEPEYTESYLNEYTSQYSYMNLGTPYTDSHGMLGTAYLPYGSSQHESEYMMGIIFMPDINNYVTYNSNNDTWTTTDDSIFVRSGVLNCKNLFAWSGVTSYNYGNITIYTLSENPRVGDPIVVLAEYMSYGDSSLYIVENGEGAVFNSEYNTLQLIISEDSYQDWNGTYMRNPSQDSFLSDGYY